MNSFIVRFMQKVCKITSKQDILKIKKTEDSCPMIEKHLLNQEFPQIIVSRNNNHHCTKNEVFH